MDSLSLTLILIRWYLRPFVVVEVPLVGHLVACVEVLPSDQIGIVLHRRALAACSSRDACRVALPVPSVLRPYFRAFPGTEREGTNVYVRSRLNCLSAVSG